MAQYGGKTLLVSCLAEAAGGSETPGVYFEWVYVEVNPEIKRVRV